MASNENSGFDGVQLHVPAVPSDKLYLGDLQTAGRFLREFADEVMAEYHRFLAGEAPPQEAQGNIEAISARYGDAFMGRDERYHIADWQGARLKGKFLGAIPSMKGGDEPGIALFRHLALMCVKASMALADGHSEQKVAANLDAILTDARDRMLGLV